MKTISENQSIAFFPAWSGAKDTKQTIINNYKVDEFDNLIDELYPEGLTETQLNDLLWFEDVWIYETFD